MARDSATVTVADLILAWRLGLADVVDGFRRVHLWKTLGLSDFRIRHRRTAIGPLWEVVSTTIMVLGLGVMFGSLFGRSDQNYFAYLGTGLVLWTYVSSILAGSAVIFTNKRQQILSVNNPLYSYVLRHVFVQLVALTFRAAPVVVLLVVVLPVIPNLPAVLAGLLMLLCTSLWVAPLVGLLAARWHAVNYLLEPIMRFLFLTTPVFWRADDLGSRAYLARGNPLANLLEVVRAPLIGESTWEHAWTAVLVFNAVGLPVALLLYGRCRRSLAEWL